MIIANYKISYSVIIADYNTITGEIEELETLEAVDLAIHDLRFRYGKNITITVYDAYGDKLDLNNLK